MTPAFVGSNPTSQYGILAQVVEHLTFNQVVRGSNPRCLIILLLVLIICMSAGMAELADAPDLGSGGRPCRFKSCYPHNRLLVKTPEILVEAGISGVFYFF